MTGRDSRVSEREATATAAGEHADRLRHALVSRAHSAVLEADCSGQASAATISSTIEQALSGLIAPDDVSLEIDSTPNGTRVRFRAYRRSK